MSINVVHYLDGTSEEFPPIAGYMDALTNLGGVMMSGPTYMGGGPGPGGGGVVKFTWRFGNAERESSVTIPLMRVHHIEERELTQADYDNHRVPTT